MELKKYDGKNREEIIKQITTELNITEDDLFIKDEEITGGLFKGKKTELTVVTKDELTNFIRETIETITKLMNIQTQVEIRYNGEMVKVLLVSENNQILIGKNGKNLEALQTIIKQAVNNATQMNIRINLDISDYKDKKIKSLEQNIKKIAREVQNSGIEVSLDPMNSYERRIVHTVVSEFPKLKTESTGEGNDRHVIIGLKEK